MVGNDIVDISEAQKASNWQRPRFLEKLFTIEEQQYISDAKSPFLTVWQLWSMKEAAYKLYSQINPSRFYNPKQFKCTLNGLKGVVSYQSFQCYVNTKITSQYILSEARLDNKPMRSKTLVSTDANKKDLSKIVKSALIQSVAEQSNSLKSDLSVLKSEFGIPSIYKNNQQLPINVSISHHGNYGAYVIT